MASPLQGSSLPRTDVAAFLRSVGAELRAADEYLCRTGAPVLASQPAAAAPMLLQAAPAEPPAVALPPAGMPSMDAGTGAAPAPAPAAAAAAEAEIASLMGFMLPQLPPEQPSQEAPAAAEGAAAAHALPDQRASAEDLPLASSRRLAAPPSPARPATAPGTTTGLPHAAAGAYSARLCQGQQRFPAEQQGSRAKVLSWLSHSDGGPCDAIPAVHAAAPQPAAAQHACPPEESWRLPLPQRAAVPLRRSPVQRLAPADYCAQLQRAGTPRKLQLTRLACQGCGQTGQACSCSAAGAAPLRLLRPRQPAYTSPGRHRGSGGGQQTRQPEPCGMASAGSHAFCPASAGQPASFSIATIQNAYFGDASMLQHGIGAAALGQPGAAPQLACLPPPPAAASTGGNGGGTPQLDVWAAYLAARRQAASEAAAGAGPAAGQSSGGPLAELRGIAQRIRSMQGHISGFLLRQRGGPATAAVATADAQWGSASCAPLPAGAPPAGVLPAAAAQPAQLAPASAGEGRNTGSLFTDDFILSMQVGTDWRQLERAALEVATGRSGAAGAGAAGAGNLGARSGTAATGGSGALQRLKQAQRVVTAERVGRQVQRAA